MFGKIAIIDDVMSLASPLKRSIEDDHYLHNPEVVIVSKPSEIDNFHPEGFGLLIIDQNLFNGFNAKSEMLEGFTQGESMAKKFVDGGYRGKIILYTGDYKLVEKRNNPGFLSSLFGSDKIEGVEYIDRGSDVGQDRLRAIIAEYYS